MCGSLANKSYQLIQYRSQGNQRGITNQGLQEASRSVPYQHRCRQWRDQSTNLGQTHSSATAALGIITGCSCHLCVGKSLSARGTNDQKWSGISERVRKEKNRTDDRIATRSNVCQYTGSTGVAQGDAMRAEDPPSKKFEGENRWLWLMMTQRMHRHPIPRQQWPVRGCRRHRTQFRIPILPYHYYHLSLQYHACHSLSIDRRPAQSWAMVFLSTPATEVPWQY